MLREITDLAKKFTTVEAVANELKSVQSTKCRLGKQKARKDYEVEMSNIVCYEQALKEVRQLLDPKNVPTTQMIQSDIDVLTFDETIKAIKSIQSKKCNSQYLSDNTASNLEYQSACHIEEMLLAHKKLVLPVDATLVRKSDVKTLVSEIENLDKVPSKRWLLEQLAKLV